VYAYDAGGHLASEKSYDARTTTYAYDASTNVVTKNSLLSILYPDATHEYFSYDYAGRLATTSQDSGANPVSFGYSSGLVCATDAGGGTSRFYFDARGLLIKTIDALGNATTSSYDANYNLTSVKGPTGLTQSFTYDVTGNLLSSKGQGGYTTTFTYSGVNTRLASVSDPKGNKTTYTYDAKGNLTATTDANAKTESLTYNALGNPLTLVNRRGQTVRLAYNAYGQVTSQILADGTTQTFTYDARGNLTSAVDAEGTTTLTYDAGDRLTKITYPGGRFLSYLYDLAGRRTRMTDQSGYALNYGYDALGRLATLIDRNGTTLITYSYDELGRVARETKGNGTYTTYQYDGNGNIVSLVNYSPKGVVNSRSDYVYDARGLATKITILEGVWNYGYNADGELTSAVLAPTKSGVSLQNMAYSYDAAGNRTQTVINSVTTVYTTNKLNQYTKVGSTSLAYDLDGNLISASAGSDSTTYTYDSLNRPVGQSSTLGDAWSYAYNALGQRASTTHNGLKTTSLIDPVGLGNVVGMYDNAGVLIAKYTYGLGLVSQVVAGVNNYYDFNAMGSTLDMTGTAGTVVNAYQYLPFGRVVSTTGSLANPFQFVGAAGVMQNGQNQGGLLDMRARFYDVGYGSFQSQDPLGLSGGQINVYGYARNNPVQLNDPSGMFIPPLIIAIDIYLETIVIPAVTLWIANHPDAVDAAVAYVTERLGGTGLLPTSMGDAVGQLASKVVDSVLEKLGHSSGAKTPTPPPVPEPPKTYAPPEMYGPPPLPAPATNTPSSSSSKGATGKLLSSTKLDYNADNTQTLTSNEYASGNLVSTTTTTRDANGNVTSTSTTDPNGDPVDPNADVFDDQNRLIKHTDVNVDGTKKETTYAYQGSGTTVIATIATDYDATGSKTQMVVDSSLSGVVYHEVQNFTTNSFTTSTTYNGQPQSTSSGTLDGDGKRDGTETLIIPGAGKAVIVWSHGSQISKTIYDENGNVIG
jgi:RHS repeat-associated protein